MSNEHINDRLLREISKRTKNDKVRNFLTDMLKKEIVDDIGKNYKDVYKKQIKNYSSK